MGDEEGDAGELGENALRFVLGEDDGQALRFFGHDRANGLLDGLFQDMVVEEEEGAEGLVLGGRGDVAIDGQMGEIGFDVGRAHVAGMDVLAGAFFVKEDEAFDPADVALFGAIGVVFATQGVAHLIEKFGLGGIGRHDN